MKATPAASADELIRGLDQYAEVLGCCVPTVRKLLADGTLPGKMIGNSYMTTRGALLDAIAKQGGDHGA